jgi:outer membrane protein OmpU
MRRSLCALCALTATSVAALGGAAHAQPKFNVTLSGNVWYEHGFVSQSNDEGLRSTEARNRFRMNIIPRGVADNGLEYGARLRIRTVAGGVVDNDRSYLFLNGSMGELRLGAQPGFDDEVNGLGANASRPPEYLPDSSFSQWTGFVPAIRTATNGRYTGADVVGGIGSTMTVAIFWPALEGMGLTDKLLYKSPRVAGFQVGGSYTPRTDSFNTDVNRVKRASTPAAQFTGSFQDVTEVGANYVETFNDVTVRLAAAYAYGKASQTTDSADRFSDLREWHIGAQINYGGLKFGADYIDHGKSGQNLRYAYTARFSAWDVGATYDLGPYRLALSYMEGTDPGSSTLPGNRKVSAYEAGTLYRVAPGLAVGLRYTHYIARSDRTVTATSGSPNDRGNVLLSHVALNF